MLIFVSFCATASDITGGVERKTPYYHRDVADMVIEEWKNR